MTGIRNRDRATTYAGPWRIHAFDGVTWASLKGRSIKFLGVNVIPARMCAPRPTSRLNRLGVTGGPAADLTLTEASLIASLSELGVGFGDGDGSDPGEVAWAAHVSGGAR